ncbi:MAG: type III toxin-antitoxin system ToxN/AbiQ family toxin [Oscillospiraceae bacterium]|nr:type III toxin-antitoxin system ToxN/AbiQ family toxin [Oscillospiraceae bacterium]
MYPKIYSVSDRYIAYLRSDEKLKNVFDNKVNARRHTRKYLDAVLVQNGFNYFIPFSSPKRSDYIASADGTLAIRKSIIPIIRMTTKDTMSGELELKGTLKLSNMIPVPPSELMPYDISLESDLNYRQIVLKEWDFIRSNKQMIMKTRVCSITRKQSAARSLRGKSRPGTWTEQ